MDLRAGRSKTGSSAAALNALIFSVIRALCLLFGVAGFGKDFDLIRVTGTPSEGSAVSSSDCDSLVSMEGKPSNADETRGRGGLESLPLSWFDDATRLRNGDTLGSKGIGGSSTGSCCLATIVNPRCRLETLPVALRFFGTSGMVVGNCGVTSP